MKRSFEWTVNGGTIISGQITIQVQTSEDIVDFSHSSANTQLIATAKLIDDPTLDCVIIGCYVCFC